MNFSDTEGVYTHTFEAERNVCLCDIYVHLCDIYVIVVCVCICDWHR